MRIPPILSTWTHYGRGRCAPPVLLRILSALLYFGQRIAPVVYTVLVFLEPKDCCLKSGARSAADLRAPALQVLLCLPSGLFGFLLGLVLRITGALCTAGAIRTAGMILIAGVYDGRPAVASGIRCGPKCSTSCRTLRHRVGALLLLGWRRWRWRLLLSRRRLLRRWWCLR